MRKVGPHKKLLNQKIHLELTSYKARIIYNNVGNSKDSARKCLINPKCPKIVVGKTGPPWYQDLPERLPKYQKIIGKY